MKRYVIEISDEVDSLLMSLTSLVEPDTSRDEIIRRAVATYAYLKKQVNTYTGNKLMITDKNKQTLMEVDLP